MGTSLSFLPYLALPPCGCAALRMKLKKNIATSETGFLFNPATGDSFAANALAAEIVRLLKQDRTPAAIKADLLARYDVTPQQLERDWDDLAAQLRTHNLLD